ncbi:MAG TPA: M56 family metallopeptidase [Lutibacter sp.]
MINYIIQMLLFQTLFLAVYDLFLQKETFFKWNRIYLLATPLLSFIIPLLKLESFRKTVPQDYRVYLPEVVINPQVYVENNTPFETFLGISTFIFYVGMGLFFILFLVRLTKIVKLIQTSKSLKKDNYTLIVLDEKQAAFSFFNYIFINSHLLKNPDLQIIQHELIHCKQKHTLDLLYFELLKIVLWFNPLVYVYQKRITLLHEYISDAEVVKETDKKTYFNKLLAETFNVENISFINQFFKHSLIKKRIIMITKEKSQKMKQLKYLLIAPLLLAMLLLSSFEYKSKEALEQVPLLINEILNEDALISEIKTKENETVLKTTDTINPIEIEEVSFAEIDNVPVYPGCEGTEEELEDCLQGKIATYVNANFNAKLGKELSLKTGLNKVFVMFKIDKEGNISEAKARAPHKKLEEEAIRVITSLPKMTPGKHKGKTVGVKYSLPIAFMVEGKEQNAENTELPTLNSSERPIFILDDVEISYEEMQKIDPNTIKSIHVFKDKNAMEKYGEKGKNGVVVITIKE